MGPAGVASVPFWPCAVPDAPVDNVQSGRSGHAVIQRQVPATLRLLHRSRWCGQLTKCDRAAPLHSHWTAFRSAPSPLASGSSCGHMFSARPPTAAGPDAAMAAETPPS